jgi:hypothetical protein
MGYFGGIDNTMARPKFDIERHQYPTTPLKPNEKWCRFRLIPQDGIARPCRGVWNRPQPIDWVRGMADQGGSGAANEAEHAERPLPTWPRLIAGRKGAGKAYITEFVRKFQRAKRSATLCGTLLDVRN